MKSVIYTVRAEATVEQAKRLHMSVHIGHWLPDEFYICQEATTHNLEQEGPIEFSSYEEGFQAFKELFSTRYQDGRRWEATLQCLEHLSDDGAFLGIEFAPFEDDCMGDYIYTGYSDKQLVDAFDATDFYIPELCEEMCWRAGLYTEWMVSDGDTFEGVVDRAYEILKEDLDEETN